MPAEEAYSRGVSLLARREHSRAELERKLVEREFAMEAIAAACDRLEKEKLLSDERFAEAFVRSRVNRGYGPLRIGRGLEERGVGRKLAERKLVEAETECEVDWRRSARDVRQRRFGAELPENSRDLARQARFLLSRGFTAEQVRLATGQTRDVD